MGRAQGPWTLGGRAALFSLSPVLTGRTMRPYARCMRRFSPFWKTYTGTSQRLGITSVSRVGWARLCRRDSWKPSLTPPQSCGGGSQSLGAALTWTWVPLDAQHLVSTGACCSYWFVFITSLPLLPRNRNCGLELGCI